MSSDQNHGAGYPVRDEGDAWVVGPGGERYWGRFGAAGVLAHDPQRGILLQHRVGWSHFGGTWGIPGGARHRDEPAVAAALREATEEAGLPAGSLRVFGTRVRDLGFWSYVTVLALVVQPFEPRVTDRESVALRWVPLDQVSTYPLHPKFAEDWPILREILLEESARQAGEA